MINVTHNDFTKCVTIYHDDNPPKVMYQYDALIMANAIMKAITGTPQCNSTDDPALLLGYRVDNLRTRLCITQEEALILIMNVQKVNGE